MASSFQPPKPFQPQAGVNLAQAWRDWKELFELYLVAAEKENVEDAVKVGILKYSMGPEWIKVAKTFTYVTDEDDEVLANVLEKFDEYFQPKKLLKAYITRFQKRVQGPNESLNDFIADVRELGSQCEFGETEETQVSIQISNGVRDKKLQEKLWEDDLSLQDIIRRCHQYDQLQETRQITSADPGHPHHVNAVSRGRGSSRGRSRGRSHRGRGRSQGTSQQYQQPRPYNHQSSRGRGRGRNMNQDCLNCGRTHAPRRCPAFGKPCNNCGKLGHFSVCCKYPRQVRYMDSQAQYQNSSSSIPSSNQYHDQYVFDDVENIDDVDAEFESLNVRIAMENNVDVFMADTEFLVDLPVQGGQIVKFRIDTGADTSIISRRAFNELRVKPIVARGKTPVKGLFGASRLPDGFIVLPVKYKGTNFNVNCQIIDSDVPNLLSVHDSRKMGLVKRVYQIEHDSIVNKFSDVFQGVGRIPGDYTLQISPDARPVALNARPIPAALREPTRSKLNELEKKDIIRKIPVGEPTPWCSALHVVPKKSQNQGKVDVRITIDPQHLNKALKREYHPIATIEDVITRTNGSRYFTVLDANQGYFQIALDEESQKITAFNTPFGRYMYKRLPMGISSAPEIYQRAMNDMFADIQGVEIVMDDILVHAPTVEIHNQRLEKVLTRCREKNLKLNARKTKLCAEEVTYIGHRLTKDGVKIDDAKVKAVLEMPEPASIANVQTLLGMVTYTCKFLPNLSEVTEPLRNLIKESNEVGFKFYFNEDHKAAVQRLKDMMTNAPVLKYYSSTEPITISGDASQAGLGTVLLQNGKPVAYGSKALTETEKNYSQIEKEMLAIVFGLKKFHTYVYGRSDVTIETDHLPLVRIMDKPLHQVPLRLQKMRMALQHYDFNIVGKSGKEIPVADALSRAYLPETESKLMRDVNHEHVFAVEVRGLTAFSEKRQAELREKTKSDAELQEVAKTIQRGWPMNRQEVAPRARAFWDSRDELAVMDEVVFKGDRVVIPKAMQSDILKIIHESHLGIVKCKQLARDIVYWPGMNAQIEDTVNKCKKCQENKNEQQKEPMIPSEIPTRPWEVVAADLLYCCGRNFLVITDYYSDFIEVEELCENTHSSTVIAKLARIFAVHGKPDKLRTDNGPQFRSHQFYKFAEDWNISHVTTSPYHHQANGKVERANQTIRHMMEKAQGNMAEFYYGLLQLRNTPNPDVSPSQRLMSRRTATKLPTANSLLQPRVVQSSKVQANIEKRQENSSKNFNKRTRSLQPLKQGDTVRVRAQNKWLPAQLAPNQPGQPRSYNIINEDGNILRRNRRDILKTKETEIYQRAPRDFDLGARDSAAVTTSQNPIQPAPNILTQPNAQPPPPKPKSHIPVPHSPNLRATPRKFSQSGRMIKMPARFDDYVM